MNANKLLYGYIEACLYDEFIKYFSSILNDVHKSIEVYFYFTRFIIPGLLPSDGAYIGLILTIIRQLPSGLNIVFTVLTKIIKARLNC